MSLTLDLAPEVEHSIREYAAAEKTTPSNLIARLIAEYKSSPAPVAPPENEPAWQANLRIAQQRAREAFAQSGVTEEQVIFDTEAEVKAFRTETYAQTVGTK